MSDTSSPQPAGRVLGKILGNVQVGEGNQIVDRSQWLCAIPRKS